MRVVPAILSGLLALTACQPLPGPHHAATGSPAAAKASITVGVQLGVPFHLQAVPTTTTSVANLKFELLDANNADALLTTTTQAGATCTFANLVDGNYKVRVTALNGASASIVQGAPPVSGVIGVSSGVVTYPGGLPGLTINVPLLDGTGERVSNSHTVTYLGGTTTADHATWKLIRTSDSAEVATYTGTGSAGGGGTVLSHFAQVPDGTYRLTTEAFDAANRSITDGGPKTSDNTVTVASPTVTYSNGGSSFVSTLNLFIDTWAAIAFPTNLMGGHASATGADGKIYLFSNANAEVFDPVANTWTAIAGMPTGRTRLGAALAGSGKIYAIGGEAAAVRQATVEEYDPATDTWAARTPMPTARTELAVAAANGMIYAFGGVETSGSFSTVVEAYDPATDTWTTKAAMPAARASFSAATVNNKIYVSGGYFAAQNRVDEYDPATNTWTQKANMPTGRNGHGSAAANGRIYVFSGNGCCGNHNSVEEYNPATNAWLGKRATPEATNGATAATAPNGKIYVFDGFNLAHAYTP